MVWAALDRAVHLAEQYGLQGNAERWQQSAQEVRQFVLEQGYDPDVGAFVQAVGSKDLDASNLLIPMLELLPFEDPRVQRTLDRTLEHLTKNGMVYRYRADDGLPGEEGTFGLCTFWLVDVLTLSGRLDEAHAIFEGMVRQANHLGLYAEQIDPESGTFLGNFPQAFTHIGLINSTLYLADEEGLGIDGFTLAAQYAAKMLPQIFRQDDPVLEVELAPEHRTKLQQMVLGLPAPVFQADDSLGWVYQFWQVKEKERVNREGKKIGADELPAVTQLFTEDYMVRFLLENTLGAWWMGRHPDEPLPVEMPYLRTLDDGAPAAGTFDGWPDRAAEITVMDPCMGSGHFLVAALHILAPMRMAEEGLSAREAVDAVLRDNLFGLELDPRCTQIAAFALAFAAWTYPDAEGYRELPTLNLACSGLAPEGKLDDWLKLAGADERMQNGMRRLYALFQQAPILGSLIDPGAHAPDVFAASFQELQPMLAAAMHREEIPQDAEVAERRVQAQGIAKAAELLACRYTLVATNVPYLTRGKQSTLLLKYCEKHHARAKADLAAVSIDLCKSGGTHAVVSPENWLFATTYEAFRTELLTNKKWALLVRLGPAAFQDMNWWAIRTILLIITSERVQSSYEVTGTELPYTKTAESKPLDLKRSALQSANQLRQLEHPDARISLHELKHLELLENYASAFQGISPADLLRYGRLFWELHQESNWVYWQGSVPDMMHYGGRSRILWWCEDLLEAVERGQAYIRGDAAWGQRGVSVSQMRNLPVTLYTGEKFDTNNAIVIPHNQDHLPAIWAYCSSPEYHRDVRRIDKALKVTNASLVKVPFDLTRWQKVADEKYPNGLPAPFSEDPTQWIFHGHPAHTTDPLQVAVARLVGYRWPSEQDADMELSAEARALIEQVEALNEMTDEDGIVCIPAVAGERPAADRLQALLRAAYGDEWKPGTLRTLLEDAGVKRGDLNRWLRDKFFDQHSKLFGHRPFVWHIWDGTRDGFGALVNYHKLDYNALKRLTYTYLGDWIRRQKAALAHGEDGAEGRLLAAQELQRKLELILEGEPPYDIFVRWKPLEEQPIGWEPDLNDGVLVNIYPFVKAGVLRKNPNVKWTKDRGTNPDDAPWGPIRHNRYEDLDDRYKLKDERGRVIPHLTNAVKKQAREQAAAVEAG